MIAVQHLAVQNLQRQRILHQLLDGPLQRTSAEVRIEAFGEQQILGGVGELDGNLALSQQAAHILETKLDDFDQLLLAERAEDDDVIHAVEELGLEVAVQGMHHLFGRLIELLFRPQTLSLQEGRPEV